MFWAVIEKVVLRILRLHPYVAIGSTYYILVYNIIFHKRFTIFIAYQINSVKLVVGTRGVCGWQTLQIQ